MDYPQHADDASVGTSQGQKRTADTFSYAAALRSDPSQDTAAPRILRRHRHRRRNVAVTIWSRDAIPGPLTPGIPQTPIAPTFSYSPPPFNIYKSLLRHPNLFFQFALRLPYPSIIALYAIDKEFHYRLNKYSVSLIHDYARYHAPLLAPIFTWVLYPELCISDPMLRPMDGREWLARDVPGFRWVGMVLQRQQIIRAILTNLALEGLRVPRECEGVLAKYWCVMESKSIALRQAFLKDSNIWSDEEILLFQLLLMKLDMRFSDPVVGNGVGEMSHMLLTQKGLGMLWKVLSREIKMDYDQVTDVVVRTYLSEDLDTETHTWLDDELDNGVPDEEWGLLRREGWHIDGKSMDSAVDMIIMESIRRGLDVQKYYLEFLLYGFVDENGGNVPVPRVLRQGSSTGVVEVGWPNEEMRGAALGRLRSLASVDEMDAEV